FPDRIILFCSVEIAFKETNSKFVHRRILDASLNTALNKDRVLIFGAQTSSGGSGNSLTESTTRGPHFDASASKNVTALLGKTAYLNCRVKNLTNRTI
ncbi:hypothetical protein NQ315_005145, partial [Exocentrus adspersus]